MKQLHILGEHYNARGLSPEKIASSFVPPAQFDEVSAASNCVLVGPRGSGKTTLLRMLDPRAQYAWSGHSEARFDPSYIGIFVPIDAAWVSALTNAVRPSNEVDGGRAYLSVYSLSVARSLVDVMRWRLSRESEGSHFHVSQDLIDESALAERLAQLWMPERKVRSLLELRMEIASQIALFPRKWQRLAKEEQIAMASTFLNPLELTAAACDVFNLLANEPDRKWALLCDELEIAPIAIQEVLFAGLRAAPQPLLLKYALTPKQRIPFGDGSEQPLPANDYDVVSLSYPTREEGAREREREQFCVALWRSLVQELYPASLDSLNNPFRVFENPGSRREMANQANLDEKFGRTFRELASKDESFSAYMRFKGVDLDDLDQSDQRTKDSAIRKVRAVAEIRNFYLTSDKGERVKKKPRRSLQPYCGAEQLFAVSEGHPRWLKYTLAAMLSEVAANGRIKVSDQNRELEHSLQRIESRIRALPAEHMSTHELVEVLGQFFSGQVLGDTFRPDPALSFIVDKDVRPDVIGCLEQALYIGAVIPMQGDVLNLFTKGLYGQRFRLSNWLAPLYRLPLVAGKAINLSTILSGKDTDASGLQFPLRLSDESLN